MGLGSSPATTRDGPRDEALVGGLLVGHVALIRVHWPEILRIAASIRTGTVTRH